MSPVAISGMRKAPDLCAQGGHKKTRILIDFPNIGPFDDHISVWHRCECGKESACVNVGGSSRKIAIHLAIEKAREWMESSLLTIPPDTA